jgi:hypothetical protein
VVFDFSATATPLSDSYLNSSAYQQVINQQRFANFPPIEAKGVLLPVSSLRSSAMSMAHINMFPDNDGTLRWETLAILYDSMLYPSIGLQAATAYLGLPVGRVSVNAAESINAGKTSIPTDKWARTVINYYGPGQTFRHISIIDILDDKIPPRLLEDCIVVIGATSPRSLNLDEIFKAASSRNPSELLFLFCPVVTGPLTTGGFTEIVLVFHQSTAMVAGLRANELLISTRSMFPLTSQIPVPVLPLPIPVNSPALPFGAT